MANTDISSKNTGDFLSAIEFNQLNDSINSKIDGGFSLSELRSLSTTNVTKTKIFYCSEVGKEGFWKYDSSDITSVDDGIFVIVTSGGKRLKSINNYYVNNIYFQPSGSSKMNSTSFIDFGNNSTTFLKLLTTNGNLMLQSGGTFSDNGDKLQVSGDAYLSGKLKLGVGSNKAIGSGTLSGGTVTISNTLVTTNSVILVSRTSNSGTTGQLAVTNKTANTSFTVTSSSNTDTSTFDYIIFN